MAETVHLTLAVAGGGEQIEGDSTQTSLGRADTIECLSLEQSAKAAYAARTGATGRRSYLPLRFTKRIDRASPRLARALAQNEPLEGTFRFYRDDPGGSGTTEHFFTVALRDIRVVGLRQVVEDVLRPETAALPPLEEVAFAFRTITWTFEDGGIEFEDTWSLAT